ncbi:MAG: hypothetical protein HeimC2_11380 [Candidatus Heimdallarchaeota archaeon LC_2]|nr:MAG: hypothetical protein HeimC2_11380 [Candidatus Heimdallarchaeota archaeon LC_2]
MSAKYSNEQLVELWQEVNTTWNVELADEILHPDFTNSFPNSSLKWGFLNEFLDESETFLDSENKPRTSAGNPVRQALIDWVRRAWKRPHFSQGHGKTNRIVISENSAAVYITSTTKFIQQPENSTIKFTLDKEVNFDVALFIEFKDNLIYKIDVVTDWLSMYHALGASFINFDQIEKIQNYLSNLRDDGLL